MVETVDTALVNLWGHTVGAVSWRQAHNVAVFEYDRDFLRLGLDLSPLHMPLSDARQGDGLYSFPELNRETFKGLPGLLADSLPDKFGNAIIDVWLARNGRDPASFNPVERLCYTGVRGMGALEYSPAINGRTEESVPVEVSELVSLAQQISVERDNLDVELNGDEQQGAEAIMDILRVGTSAGGARPKAIIAMDHQGHVRSGQVAAPPGYSYWLLKFDGVDDLELGKPRGYGRIEYAYHRMAVAAGIHMVECRLYRENGRAHFLTKRFDRVAGKKLHMQSLCALGHFDFNLAGAYGYEQAFAVMRQLRLSKAEAEQQFRRMVFNVLARNQDDHAKNISFLMKPDGTWRLSPAFDLTYSHNPAGKWTNQHQMTINGKRDHFTLDDLLAVGESISLPDPKGTIKDVSKAVSRWPEFAVEAAVPAETVARIQKAHRILA